MTTARQIPRFCSRNIFPEQPCAFVGMTSRGGVGICGGTTPARSRVRSNRKLLAFGENTNSRFERLVSKETAGNGWSAVPLRFLPDYPSACQGKAPAILEIAKEPLQKPLSNDRVMMH